MTTTSRAAWPISSAGSRPPACGPASPGHTATSPSSSASHCPDAGCGRPAGREARAVPAPPPWACEAPRQEAPAERQQSRKCALPRVCERLNVLARAPAPEDEQERRARLLLAAETSLLCQVLFADSGDF